MEKLNPDRTTPPLEQASSSQENSANTSVKNSSDESKITTPSLASGLYEYCSTLFEANPGLKQNNLGKVFACFDVILQSECLCRIKKKDKDKSWPYNSVYDGEVRTYLYFGVVIEMSILVDKSANLSDLHYYFCLSFSRKTHLYYVEEISPLSVPTMSADAKATDYRKIMHVFRGIMRALSEFVTNVIRGDKIPRPLREYTLDGIYPTVSDDRRDESLKRKRNCSSDEEDFDIPRYYVKLRDMYETMNPKPNELTKVFAIIYNLLISEGHTSSLPADQWLFLPSYQNQIINMRFNIVSDSNSFEIPRINAKLSLLNNQKEFFMCLRCTSDPKEKCVKKFSRVLAPSFDRSEIGKEMEKLENLSKWLDAIIEKLFEEKKRRQEKMERLEERREEKREEKREVRRWQRRQRGLSSGSDSSDCSSDISDLSSHSSDRTSESEYEISESEDEIACPG